jgi:phytol kinase
MISGLFIILFLYILVFLLAEFLYKKGFSSEITRKITHIGGGFVSVLLPIWLNLWTAVAVGIFFSLVLLISKRKKILDSVHKINNQNMGAVLFPVGLTITFVLFVPIKAIIFQSAVLVLALADGLGGLLGQRYGRLKYNISGNKTWEGSFIFLIISFLVLLSTFIFLDYNLDIIKIAQILLGAIVITIFEGLLGKGWDNLAIPIVAGAVIYFLI